MTVEYRCPHCDAVVTELRAVQTVPTTALNAVVGTVPRRGPYRLRPEFLGAVLDEYDRGGLPAIAVRWKVSERTARRYWAAASTAVDQEP